MLGVQAIGANITPTFSDNGSLLLCDGAKESCTANRQHHHTSVLHAMRAKFRVCVLARAAPMGKSTGAVDFKLFSRRNARHRKLEEIKNVG
jgi:hypothetical protein